MSKTAAALLAACLTIAGCAAGPATSDDAVVRSTPPRQYASAITNYFDATATRIDPNRELVIGAPQRGACPMRGDAGTSAGWVVPVEYKTHTKDSTVVTVSSYLFFWFSGEVIRGITRKMTVCP
jgi:hypothetical protein